jgi:hypothetical protein
MPATNGFQAGLESGAVRVNYGQEVNWGVAPSVAFKQLRMMGESMAGTKARSKPPEINYDRQASASVTTQESAAGGINFALSYGTYDDLFAGTLGEDYTAPVAIVGVAGDITLTVAGSLYTLSSATANKFAALAVGQWVRLSGFTNAANNGFYRVGAKASNLSVTLVGGVAGATETPAGVLAKVTSGGYLRNDLDFQSFYVEKQLGSGLFLRYPGTYFSAMNINGRVGQFMQGSFTGMSKEEVKAALTASTGAIVAAPTGRVHDTVANFEAPRLDDVLIGATIQGVDLTLTNDGAAADYGLGSASAQGMRGGTFTGTGRVDTLFKTLDLWDRFKAETGGRFSFRSLDNLGQGYVFTALNATIMNPKINASGPNVAVPASFDLEMNPDPVTGKTFQIDRFGLPV